jgi:hypothetical protein
LLHAAFAPAAAKRSRTVQVRAEGQSSGDVQVDRRSMLGAGLALAAATSLPLSMPAPALANKVLSTDWEEVRSRIRDVFACWRMGLGHHARCVREQPGQACSLA